MITAIHVFMGLCLAGLLAIAGVAILGLLSIAFAVFVDLLKGRL